MIYWIIRRLRRIGREAICIGIGHRITTRQRGPRLSNGLDVWCQRDCGLREMAR